MHFAKFLIIVSKNNFILMMNRMMILNKDFTAKQQIEPLLLKAPNEPDVQFPSELLAIDLENVPAIYDQSKKIMVVMLKYKELMMMYTCALKEMHTRLDVLNTEFSFRHQRNPINFINMRLKRSSSIIEKLGRNNIPLSVENIENGIDDVAGIRVICSYVDDIYLITEALEKQNDVELISKKDYIANPKPNGYRSLHMIVRIPVFFENDVKHVKVEIQIRTIAMDFWATLEHELKYKNQLLDGDEIASELKVCAGIISNADFKMLEIRKRIEANRVESTEEDMLFEQMKKLENPFM